MKDNAKMPIFIIFDIILILWALLAICAGFDEMYAMRHPYQTLLYIFTAITGLTIIFLKFKFQKHIFKMFFYPWLIYSLLTWLAFEFIIFSHYNIPPGQRIHRLIKSIYFEGLINLLYPFILINLIILTYLILAATNKRLSKLKER
jgi:hypothetical protein